MKTALYIDGSDNEVRVARLEGGKLEELFIERPEENHCAGNIYKGKVSSILPGIQAAFVDIGLGKNGFLYVDDVIPIERQTEFAEDDFDDLEGGMPQKKEHRTSSSIKNLLKEGQEIVVQVTKDPLGTKGPRLTCYISLPGRYMVYMPDIRHKGVSRKIEKREERHRLREILGQLKPKTDAGLIVRTVGEGREKKDFERDLKYLERLWHTVARKLNDNPAPAILFNESSLLVRVLRDTLNDDVSEIHVESREDYRTVKSFLSDYGKNLKAKLLYHKKAVPLFEDAKIEKEIEKLYRRKVWLKCGGYIIIEQTEALISIDVNTGRNKGVSDRLEETVFITNLEAAEEISRQLRLRNLGGIIIIDFIDMEKRRNKQLVYEALDRSLKRDKAKTKINQISKLGLIEMSRQRVRKSLASVTFQDCPYCSGEGVIKSGMSLGLDMIRRIKKAFSDRKVSKITIALHPENRQFIMKNFERELSMICQKSKKEVEMRSNKDLRRDEVNMHILERGRH